MRLPTVIDNETHVLAEVLRAALAGHAGGAVDVATAYFNVGGFAEVRTGIGALGHLRLLLGAEPQGGVELGLVPRAQRVRGLLEAELAASAFGEETLRVVEELIAWLRRPEVEVRLYEHGFLHAKAWLFFADRDHQRVMPRAAIVGSSNFTKPGLTTNRELNLTHKVLLDDDELHDPAAHDAVSFLHPHAPDNGQVADADVRRLKGEVGARAVLDLERWFADHWAEGRDFKEELIAVLDASKFGEHPYTPYEVYLKALHNYFAEDLADGGRDSDRAGLDLAEFQADAVQKAKRILARYDGVMIADSVGLGKTWIGKALLDEYAYHGREKTLVVCPAALKEMWQGELRHDAIAADVVSQEMMGREDFLEDALHRHGDCDLILVDESHNFRNPLSQRYANLSQLVQAGGGRGRKGRPKKVVLLTATPISNDLFDLYHQLMLITKGDKAHFASVGIGDLQRYFRKARRAVRGERVGLEIFNLLEEIVVRRTRSFIRKAYPEATIGGRRIHFPERRLRTVQYNLEEVYEGIYPAIVAGVEKLRLAPYNVEKYRRLPADASAEAKQEHEFQLGREAALVGIFKSQYLKRFESSVEAFRISVRRALAFFETFESYVLDGRLLASSDFRRALRLIETEQEEDDVMPTSMADRIDAEAEARAYIDTLPQIAATEYDLRRLHGDLRADIEILRELYRNVQAIGPDDDAKLDTLKGLLASELKGRKVLVFTYYKDTARYLYRQLGNPETPGAGEFLAAAGAPNVKRIDSGADARERLRIVERFAPLAQRRADLAGSPEEIDVLIATDVLSEGQNLQDAPYLLNYDLHWNPTRMVQRAGRIDRIGTNFDTLWIYNMFPDAGLESLLKIVESLSTKIEDINRTGFLDASVLGEAVDPRNFNTLRRIREEDGSLIEEEEKVAELASSEDLVLEIRRQLAAGMAERLAALPDGIHSGLVKGTARGIFFYFQADDAEGGIRHFWRYWDARTDGLTDNRLDIASLIACEADTPRVVAGDLRARVFEVQEKVIAAILADVDRQEGTALAPGRIEAVQTAVGSRLAQAARAPGIDRNFVLDLRRFVTQPMLPAMLKELKKVQESTPAGDHAHLVSDLGALRDRFAAAPSPSPAADAPRRLRREDLRLICWDVLSG